MALNDRFHVDNCPMCDIEHQGADGCYEQVDGTLKCPNTNANFAKPAGAYVLTD